MKLSFSSLFIFIFLNYCRRIPYLVALKHKNDGCAALLNPSSAEPLVWPSPLKFISELNQDAKALLEQALMEANREREKTILKGTSYSIPSPSHSETESADDNISEVIPSNLIYFISTLLPVFFLCLKSQVYGTMKLCK